MFYSLPNLFSIFHVFFFIGIFISFLDKFGISLLHLSLYIIRDALLHAFAGKAPYLFATTCMLDSPPTHTYPHTITLWGRIGCARDSRIWTGDLGSRSSDVAHSGCPFFCTCLVCWSVLSVCFLSLCFSNSSYESDVAELLSQPLDAAATVMGKRQVCLSQSCPGSSGSINVSSWNETLKNLQFCGRCVSMAGFLCSECGSGGTQSSSGLHSCGFLGNPAVHT